ncbi:Putative purine permease YwdJ [Paraliobacillus sp. PM-2]|uniref:purine/pyrimidine permease n=1 Tax=Paraliobacillus sp. PM-2 TaxID=1462524 RepID=UPI00061C7D82|nr:purine/pyrimidine permease [Paraliobacillus sp. PM-2]CQR47157.1 Putative purine permease YwdJ [Paraliobacillus sp. PM-2]
MKKENKILSIFQWFIYLLANSIAIPIVVGDIFQLSAAEISSLMQRVFFIIGLSSIIQAKFGHRYPIADGPAGSWVSIFVIYASIGMEVGKSMTEVLQILMAGLFISGLILFLLGITKWVRSIVFLFTPIVTGTFLLILAIQLSGVFLKGMAIDNESQMDLGSFMLSLMVFFLIILLSTKGKGWIKSYAVLIGILFGWLLFAILKRDASSLSISKEIIELPKLFVWGFPEMNISIVITAILFTFLLISNTIASISSIEEAIPSSQKPYIERLYSGTWVGGITHLLTSIFSTVGIVPLPATAGFVKLTKQYRITPFIFACGLLIAISLFPSIVGILSSLPLQVASAALLATLIEMYGIAYRSLRKQPFDLRNGIIIVVSLVVGVTSMNIPREIYSDLPTVFQYILSNGLLIGTIMAISLEQFLKIKR